MCPFSGRQTGFCEIALHLTTRLHSVVKGCKPKTDAGDGQQSAKSGREQYRRARVAIHFRLFKLTARWGLPELLLVLINLAGSNTD